MFWLYWIVQLRKGVDMQQRATGPIWILARCGEDTASVKGVDTPQTELLAATKAWIYNLTKSTRYHQTLHKNACSFSVYYKCIYFFSASSIMRHQGRRLLHCGNNWLLSSSRCIRKDIQQHVMLLCTLIRYYESLYLELQSTLRCTPLP